jgi:glycine/D-amino acid oxidase-like deaminating enzyme
MLTAEPKAYGSNWYAATRVEGPARRGSPSNSTSTVCVIGAGLAGLTVAREVARLGWSVVVLEAKSVAWSASGRNTGVVLPGFAVGADALIERVGLDGAKACGRVLWRAPICPQRARDMPGAALSENGWLHVSKTDDIRALAHEAALVAGEFGARSSHGRPTGARGVAFPALFSRPALSARFQSASAQLCARSGGRGRSRRRRIFEDTPVLEIDPAGVRKRVVTRDSRVRAAMWCSPATCI